MKDEKRPAPGGAVTTEPASGPSIEEIARTTAEQRLAREAAAPTFAGSCLRAADSANPGRCLIRFEDERGETVERWLRYASHAAPAAGDEVVLTQPRGGTAPLVLARLARAGGSPAIPLPNGYQLDGLGDERARVRLQAADGTTVLELDLSGEVPGLKLPQQDLTLDLDGRLAISAEAIDLVAKQGAVNINAADDVRVVGKLIWLN